MPLESLISKARAAGYAMGNPDERPLENGSADQRWSKSSDPMIVQRFATMAARHAAKKFALVRSKAAAFRPRNLPVVIANKRRAGRSRWTMLVLSNWWGGGEAA